MEKVWISHLDKAIKEGEFVTLPRINAQLCILQPQSYPVKGLIFLIFLCDFSIIAIMELYA